MESTKRLFLLIIGIYFLPTFSSAQTWFQEFDVWHFELTGLVTAGGYERINPVNQNFSIQLPKEGKLESITLFTLDDKAMKTFPGPATEDLYIGDLAAGMYVIRLKLTDPKLAFA